MQQVTAIEDFVQRSKRPSSSSQFRGVKRERKRWLAQIVRRGVSVSVGRFDDEEQAARAYDDAVRERFGVAAPLNFPTPLEAAMRLREHFHSYTRLTEYHPDDCWDWIGPVQINPKYPECSYGKFCHDGKYSPAHRVSYEIYRGEIPDGLYACHTCDRPLCVNPHHLFLGTHAENMADCIAKGRQRGAEGEKNSHAKLTAEHVKELRTVGCAGLKGKCEAARKYGVSVGTIYSAMSNRTWRAK